METFQVTTFSFPCITIHQTFLIRDPRRQHLYSILKWWDANISALCQSLSTNNSWPPKINPKLNITTALKISSHQTHIENIPHQKNFESFSRIIRFHLINDTTVPSSKAPN